MQSINSSFIELMHLAWKLAAAEDRVRVTEWIKKLAETAAENSATTRMVEEYIEYLKLMLKTTPIYFVDPFKKYPPKHRLVPLAETLGNALANECPFLPRTGTLAPVVLHRSNDDTATIAIHRDPDGEIFCYMAVTPRDS